MDPNLKHFVVLGGGPTGWLAAAYLNRSLNRFRPGQIAITVVESPLAELGAASALGARGLPRTLKMLGITEQSFLAHTDASFMHGARYLDWLEDPRDRPGSHFVPLDRNDGSELDPGEAWISNRALSAYDDYAHAISIQPTLADALRCPRLAGSRPYASTLEFSYQFDPAGFLGLLREVATRRGVRSVMGRSSALQMDAAGRIVSVQLDSGARIAADFFIDCDGSLSRLRHALEREQLLSYERSLLCDRQLSLELPGAAGGVIRPFAVARAATAGWIAEADLATTRRLSYVYSSAFLSDRAAERELRAYARTDQGQSAVARRFRPGRRRAAWIDNTLALGAAAGAIEPLIVPELGLVSATLEFFVENLPQHAEAPDALKARSNALIAALYDEALDLTSLYYRLSRREDTAFWRANRHDLQVSERLRQDLDIWTQRLPSARDRPSCAGLVDHQSYRFVLAGMDRIDTLSTPYEAYISPTEAAAAFQHLERARAHALTVFPDHAGYLRRLGEEQLTLAFPS